MLRTLAEKVDPRHTALIIIDMQNDFCDDEGSCARDGQDLRLVQAIVPTIQQLTGAARASGALVIFVRVAHDATTDSEVRLERRRADRAPTCIEGTWGADWYGDLRPRQSDVVVTKHRFSAFINTPLDLILRSRAIRTIVLTGTQTQVCVESTARDGHMLDYYTVIAEDGVACSDPAIHEASLSVLGRHFADIVSAQAIAQVWAKAPSTRA